MSAFNEVTVTSAAWVEIIPSSSTQGLVQIKGKDSILFRFAASLPGVGVTDGQELLPGHPIFLNLPSGEALYGRAFNKASITVKSTAY